MRIGSLFSGIGGLELGLEWAGVGETRWQVELDDGCRAVLQEHWPNADRFPDVHAVGRRNLPRVDLICGGFPCQDVSLAGEGAGLAGDRSGLWGQFARIVRELRPRFVVVENVAGGARRWLPQVRADLRRDGYHTRAFKLAAAECGAGHLRRRIFVVAHAESLGRGPGWQGRSNPSGEGQWQQAFRANADGPRLPQRQGQRGDAREANGSTAQRADGEVGGGVAGESGRGVVRAIHGLPAWVDRRFPAALEAEQFEWEAPRLEVRSKGDAQRIKALGNAVMPAQAYVIGCIVREMVTS